MSNETVLHPVLPLRDIVVFPNMVVPLFVGREKSVKALEVVMAEDKEILLSSQIDATEDEPTSEGIYNVGVLANVLQLLKLPDGTVKVLVEGTRRVKISNFNENDDYFEAVAEILTEEDGDIETIKRCKSQLRSNSKNMLKSRKIFLKRLLQP